MRKGIYVIFILLLCQGVKGQTISGDSLLQLIKQNESLEFVYSLDKLIYKLDPVSVYNHSSLKAELLKWLDRDWYVEMELNEIKNRLAGDTLYLMKKIRRKLGSDDVEGILNSPEIYQQYCDSIIQETILEVRKSRNMIRPDIPEPVLRLHMHIAYSEAYTLIRKYWEEDGLTISSRFFMPSLFMLDPQAVEMYDRKIEDIVANNGENANLNQIYDEVNSQLRNSYSVEKMLELLQVNRNFQGLSEGDQGRPFNCRLMKILISQFMYHNIERDPLITGFIACNQLDKHQARIKDAGSRLIDAHRQDEAYWKKNMPYNR